jgi:hypothetical protein
MVTPSTGGSESEVSLIRCQQSLQQIGTGGLSFDVDDESAIDKGGTFDCHRATGSLNSGRLRLALRSGSHPDRRRMQ